MPLRDRAAAGRRRTGHESRALGIDLASIPSQDVVLANQPGYRRVGIDYQALLVQNDNAILDLVDNATSGQGRTSRSWRL